MKSGDIGAIIGVAAGAAAAVAVVGLVVLRLLRNRSVFGSLFTVAIVGVLGVVVGAIAIGQLMFLSDHDLRVMLWVCGAAAVCSAITAAVVGRRLAGSSSRLRRATRELGDGTTPHVAGLVFGRELLELAAELERTSARLTASQDRERAIERSRRELVAWISHDLRSPLAGMRAMSESLEDGVAADPALYHRRIRLSAERMSSMVDDLFELSRVQVGALNLNPARVSLYDLVSDALAEMESVAAESGVQLVGEAVEAVPVHVDGREVVRAITNLLANAIRATPADGTVAVSVRRDAGRAIVAVTDTCGGIPADELTRVFDTGWRGSESRSPSEYAGAGLGLAIVRGIVEAHAGIGLGQQRRRRLPVRDRAARRGLNRSGQGRIGTWSRPICHTSAPTVPPGWSTSAGNRRPTGSRSPRAPCGPPATVIGLVRDGAMPKGEVLSTARIAGIMAAKRTAELIPLCHPVPLSAIDVELELADAARSRSPRPPAPTAAPGSRWRRSPPSR